MRLMTCPLVLGLTLAQLPGCGGTNCADGDCGSGSDTTQSSTGETTGTTGGSASGSTTSGPGTTTDTTGEPVTTTQTTGEPGTTTLTTLTTGEPGTSTGSTTDVPDTTGGTTGGGLQGEPSKMEPACAPDDGPATSFSIGLAERLCSSDFPEDAPIFRVNLFTGLPPLAPGEYELDNGNGFATWDEGNGVVNGFLGTITITEQTADGVRGTYDITFDDASNRAGDFDAIFCDADILCG